MWENNSPIDSTYYYDLLFVRLATTPLKDEESARDNHVLAYNFSKYSPILKMFSLSDSAINFFLIWLLATQPRLKYVATLPCNLSLIACFLTLMFNKVVWQHIQGMAGYIVTSLLRIYNKIFQ